MHTDWPKKRDKSAKPVSEPRSSTGSAMPCWYFEKKELRKTPSLQDGIDYETESRYRKEGARFIIDTGTKMDLGYNTMATGVVYFHRFYMYHSFKHFPRYVTACCCLFLAGKVEETPKKCKDIIKTARGQLTDAKFATFGEDPKEEVMTLERILLQTIKFDLQVEHPYGFLLKYAKCLKGDKAKLQKMVQMAWTFVNDSLCTTLCLQWEPEVIAVALMYLAGKLSKFEVVDWQGRSSKHLRWWDMFVEDVTMDLLEDICHQVLDLYSHPQNSQTPDSPPYIRSPPPVKKERHVPQPISPGQLSHSHSPILPGIPPKGKNDMKPEDGMDKVDGMGVMSFSGYNSSGPIPGPGPGPGVVGVPVVPFPPPYAAPPVPNAGPLPAQAPAPAPPPSAPFPPSYPAGQYYPPPPHNPPPGIPLSRPPYYPPS